MLPALSQLLGPLNQKPHSLPSRSFKLSGRVDQGEKWPWLVSLIPGIHHSMFNGQSSLVSHLAQGRAAEPPHGVDSAA